MSELRSTVEMLRSETLPDLPDARIEEDFAELQRAVELLEVERLRRLAEIERRRLYERDGHLSAASWLATTFKVAWGVARDHVRAARALEEMPETRRALEEGDLSMSAVRVLVAAREADPSAFGSSEAQLVEAARIHSMGDLRRVAAYWRQTVERERSLEGDEKLRKRRRLHASVSFLGMVRVDGDLDPETGETLLTALHAVLDAESRSRGKDDDRTPAQRRADALAEICRQWLDLAERPSVAGGTTTRHGHRRCRRDRGCIRRDQRAGSRGPGPSRDCTKVGVRRVDHARRDGRELGAAGCRSPDPGRVTRDPAGCDRTGPPLPVPGLRQACHVVRRASRGPLGRRWIDRAPEPRAPVPAPPPDGPSTTWLPVGVDRRAPGVHAAGRIGAGGSGAAVVTRPSPPSGARPGGSAPPRTPLGARA